MPSVFPLGEGLSPVFWLVVVLGREVFFLGGVVAALVVAGTGRERLGHETGEGVGRDGARQDDGEEQEGDDHRDPGANPSDGDAGGHLEVALAQVAAEAQEAGQHKEGDARGEINEEQFETEPAGGGVPWRGAGVISFTPKSGTAAMEKYKIQRPGACRLCFLGGRLARLGGLREAGFAEGSGEAEARDGDA